METPTVNTDRMETSDLMTEWSTVPSKIDRFYFEVGRFQQHRPFRSMPIRKMADFSTRAENLTFSRSFFYFPLQSSTFESCTAQVYQILQSDTRKRAQVCDPVPNN
jgi:hypothetical protein